MLGRGVAAHNMGTEDIPVLSVIVVRRSWLEYNIDHRLKLHRSKHCESLAVAEFIVFVLELVQRFTA